MQFKQACEKLFKSQIFKDWKQKNMDDFLAHGFFFDDDLNKDTWQVGFYNKKKDKITTFFISKDVKVSQESEIFKRPEAKIEELNLGNIKISSNDALKTASDLQKEKYSSDPIRNAFMIIQRLEGKEVFNITVVTDTLKTINVRIDANNGKVLLEKITSLMDYRID